MPSEILTVLSAFAPLFSTPAWSKAQFLVIGALLCQGPRRITSILRVMGKPDERRFEKYHRTLNRDRWSCTRCAKILLGLIVALLPYGAPIIIAVDETLERRKGKNIRAKGCYRDAVRSSEKHVVKCFGLKWICMCLIVPMPWCKRPWALPFLTVLAPSKKANEARGRKHRTIVDWTMVMLKLVVRWLQKPFVLIGDGAYACIELGHHCNRLGVTLVSRLRLDANLFEFPEEVVPGKRGRKPKKGRRTKKLLDMAKVDGQDWQEAEVVWYGGIQKTVKYLTGVNLWYKAGETPLAIRWVLVINPDNPDRPEAFFSINTKMNPAKIIKYFVLRWNIEVTFEEVRAHLGVETQRQWSDNAIGRTTPVLMGLYSLACVIVNRMHQAQRVIPAMTAWYNKNGEATFSDIMAVIKRAIWSEKYFSTSSPTGDTVKLSADEAKIIINQLVGYG